MAEGGSNRPNLRNKKGQFTTKKKHQQQEKLAAHNAQRKQVNNDKDNAQPYLNIGERVVEFDILAKELECENCKSILSLRDVVSETQHGLASVFDVICQKCKNKRKVNCCKKSPIGESGYAVNEDLIYGLQKVGMSLDSFNKFLSAKKMSTVDPSIEEEYHKKFAEGRPDDLKIDTVIMTLIQNAKEAIETKESTTGAAGKTQ